MRGRTLAVCAEFSPRLQAARNSTTGVVAGSAPENDDTVKVARAGVYSELSDDYADLLGEKIRDLSLGLDVVDTEDYLAVVRLETGPVAAFHRAQGFPGWCLGVVAKRDIPHGHLLCLAVGEIREFEEAYCESEDEQDSEDEQVVSSGKGKEQADALGDALDDAADAADAGWCREAYDYDLLHLGKEGMAPVFLECVDYGNIARCFNDSEKPNAALVHVSVNGIPMRAVFSTRGIAAGEDVCVRYDDKHWQELYGMTRSSVVAPPPAGASVMVVISDSDDDVEMAEAPHGAASGRVHARSRRKALHGSGFYKEDSQARAKRGAPPGGRRG